MKKLSKEFKGMFLELGYGENIKIDAKDKKIMAVLSQNNRIPVSRIKKIVGLSKDSVKYRINHLIEKDILRKNLLIVNPYIFNLLPYVVCLKFGKIDEQLEKSAISFLINNPFVVWVGKCFGKWDLVITLFATDIKHFDSFIKTLKTKLRNIKEHEILNISSMFRYDSLNKKFINEQKMNIEFNRNNAGFVNKLKNIKAEIGQKAEFDAKDLLILSILSKDSSIKISDIAEKLNLSFDTLKYRINKMIENKIILGFKSIMNASFLNYQGYILFLRLKPNAIRGKRIVENFFLENEDTLFALETIGNYDFEVYILVKNHIEFNSILSKIRNTFSKELEDYVALLILKDYKLNFFDAKMLS